jgi:predicted ATPase
LSSLSDISFAGPVATRLEDQRLDVVELWADAEIMSGRVDRVTVDLERWLVRAPYRESMWHRLVFALYRSGRQADALERLARLRRLLRDELGVRPGTAIVELETAILDHDADLESPRSAVSDPDRLSGPGRRLPPAKELIGRQSLVDDVIERCDSARVVTLVGPGGVGKTSVAVNVAAARVGRDRDGVWFVDLSRVPDGSLVATAIGAAVGLHPGEGGVSIEAVTELLFDMELLLVIDNCEHVVDHSAEAIDAISRACAGVRILATSRESLTIADEVTVLVPILDPDSAITLLRQRAQRVQAPALSLQDEHLAATLCLAVDRLPLGIELVAGRLRSMSVSDIVNQLDSAALLQVDDRRVNRRHRSLHATIKWSYDLLSEVSQVLLRRLAIFEGGAHLDAILAVCADGSGGMDAHSVAERLDALVSASLVTVEPIAGRLRYRLLETVRAFALKQLDELERSESRRRHAREMIAWGRRIRQIGEGPDPAAAFASIHLEAPNLRSALQWCLSIGDHHSIVELVGAPGPIVSRHSGAIAELDSWIDVALASRDAEPAHRLDALLVGAFGWTKPDEVVRERAAEALELARSLDDPRATAFAEFLVGDAHLDVAEPRIEHHLATAIELAEQQGCLPYAGAALNSYASLLIRQRRISDAEALLRPRLRAESAYGAYEPFLRYQHARLLLANGDTEAAIVAYDDAMQAALRTAVPVAIGYAWFGKASLAYAQHDLVTARDCFERGLVIDAQLNDRRENLNDRIRLVQLCVAMGDLDAAREHATAITEISRNNPGPREVGAREQADGIIALASGDVVSAQHHLVQALNSFAPTQMTDIFAETLHTLIGTIEADRAAPLATLADDVNERRISPTEAVALVQAQLTASDTHHAP